MPVLKRGDELLTADTPEQIQAAAAEGFAPTTDTGTIRLTNKHGKTIHVTPDRLDTFAAIGYAPEGVEAELARSVHESRAQEYDTTEGAIRAFGEGGLRAMTLGLSDVAMEGLGVNPDDLAGRREFNADAEMAGQLIGGLASAGGALTKGAVGKALSFTPAGAVSRLGAGVTARVGGAITGAGGRVLAAAAGGAVEGGIYGGGQAVSDAVIENKPLTASAFVSSVASGALFGGALGGGFAAGGEVAKAGVKAAAAGAKKIASVAGRVDDAISGRVRKITDSLTSPGPREVAAEELEALTRHGDGLVKEADSVLAHPKTKAAQKVKIDKRVRELGDLAEEIAGGTADPDVIDRYHKSLTDLSADLGKAGREVAPMPANPTLREASEEGLTTSLDELGPRPKKADVARVKTEVQSTVDDLTTQGSPLLTEAKELLGPPKAASELGGDDLASMLAEAEGSNRIKKLVAKAEKSQAAFAKKFSGDLDSLFTGTQDEFADAIGHLESYGRSLRELAEEMDNIAPRAAGPARVEALATPTLRGPKATATPNGSAYDLGDMLAIADVMGLDIEDVPLIGQVPGIDTVLKARMMYRRFKGGVDKLRLVGQGARVGGVAVKAQTVTRRLQSAAKSFVHKAGGVAGKAQRLTVPTASAVLGSASFGETPPKADETPLESYTRISEELESIAQNPDQVREKFLGRLNLGDPDLSMEIADRAVARAMHLYEEMPKDARDATILQAPYDPGKFRLERFASQVWASENPVGVMELMQTGKMTQAMANTIRAVYPPLAQQMVESILDELGENPALTISQQSQLAMLSDAPVGPLQSPEFIAAMQSGYADKEPGPEPGEGNVRMTGLDQMSFQPTPANSRQLGSRRG